MSSLTIYTDGGARGNPGPAGIGAYILDSTGGVLAELHGFLGVQTNNYAEYEAVIRALSWCVTAGYTSHDIQIKADSKLIVEQMSGNWKVKDANLKPQFLKAQALVARCHNVTFTYIPREENGFADALANKGMDKGVTV